MTQSNIKYKRSCTDELMIKQRELAHQHNYKKNRTTCPELNNNKTKHIGFRQLTKAYFHGHTKTFGNNTKDIYCSIVDSERVTNQEYSPQVRKNNHAISLKEELYPENAQDKKLIVGSDYTTSSQTPLDFSRFSDTSIFYSFDNFLENSLLKNNPTRVVVKHIPKEIGIDNVVSQIKGGPLRQISCIDTPQEYKEAVIDFIYPQDATEFLKYANTNLFKVNGIHLQACLCTDNETKEKNLAHLLSLTSKNKDPQITRCLILKKNGKKRVVKRYSNGSSNSLLPFDPQEILDDFSVFGELQGLTPIISRKLCVSVLFMDVFSAMQAMRSLQDINSFLHKKYYKTWAIWYGPDLTEQPCLT
ncbi:similar to Saccharomyces cerevisiae YOR242C SSP2 Sporulation specific protein that localizes to the spore wall [Maudiozyma barnettii]|uniref:Similar to Saccharomyces cerevisiae YOR242C SSP2 Sporulation specific protein that localizes to the spore wall n=1 Tax=Maudiozyma barnettii TaxID=61262 RepID=A0A8H2ZGB4_9SACH|nr:Ssp2p [Kazachstania barnettii]CAB4253240.1 similar to Saccharomyces cerevisiae YOR242C SSP2 Sporulation specific protein that localizes to the spore wall [Kazachstania barnettii]CAD1780224.1 similar to Saccharomyces cerevisiae YOR242C SSP2 Sporulation specific protein that localizes to the spore wall [Kazachstania barnettii]